MRHRVFYEESFIFITSLRSRTNYLFHVEEFDKDTKVKEKGRISIIFGTKI